MSIYVPASVGAPPLNTQLQLWSFSMCYHYVEFVTGNVNIAFKVLWNIMNRNCTFLSCSASLLFQPLDYWLVWESLLNENYLYRPNHSYYGVLGLFSCGKLLLLCLIKSCMLWLLLQRCCVILGQAWASSKMHLKCPHRLTYMRYSSSQTTMVTPAMS